MSPAAWVPRAFAALADQVAHLPPPLDVRFRRVHDRLAGANGGHSLESALTSPAATPGIALLDAYREDLGVPAECPRMAALGEATLALYLHVRVQDDIVDEPALFDRAFVYLAEVFAGASVRAFAEAVGAAAGFFAFRERVMGRFAAGAAWETDVYHAGRADETEERRIGEKLLPMALPLGALSYLAGRPEQAEVMVAIAAPLATGLQVVNDLINAVDDHTGGRPTPVLRRLYREGRAAPGSPSSLVRAALLEGEAIEEARCWAEAEMAQAEDVAAAHGLRELSALVGRRRASLARLPQMAVAQYLQLGLVMP